MQSVPVSRSMLLCLAGILLLVARAPTAALEVGRQAGGNAAHLGYLFAHAKLREEVGEAFGTAQRHQHANKNQLHDESPGIGGLDPSKELNGKQLVKAACWGESTAPVSLLTLASGMSETYLSVLRRNRLTYAAKHGYEYCEYTHLLDSSREPPWSKVWAIEYLMVDPLEPRKRVHWLDADALIINMEASLLDDVIGPFREKDAVFTTDFGVGRGFSSPDAALNTGSMHLKNTPWVRNMLSSLYQTTSATRSSFWGLLDPSYAHEQAALMQVRDSNPEEFAKHAVVVPWEVMNTAGFGNYCDGDFVIHPAGGAARLESWLFGRYWPRWGSTDKYEQLEEFVLRLDGEQALQMHPLRTGEAPGVVAPLATETAETCGRIIPTGGQPGPLAFFKRAGGLGLILAALGLLWIIVGLFELVRRGASRFFSGSAGGSKH